MQCAIPPRVFQYLHKHFNTTWECFASPLNCYWSNFCSAWKDVDAAFGSFGDFFIFSY
eukprot:UN12147